MSTLTIVEASVAEVAAEKTHPAVLDARPTTLVIACIDPRFLISVLSFIAEELGLKPGQFILKTNLGGVLHLCEPTGEPNEFLHLHDTVKTCFQEFPSLEEAIGINHIKCRAYAIAHARRGDAFLRGMNMEQLQLNGLSHGLRRQIATAVPERTRIRSFFMRIVDEVGQRVSFREIT